jgi:hypothetical protein
MNVALIGTALDMAPRQFEELVTLAKERGATVAHTTTPAFGTGWYGELLHSRVLSVNACESEREAWAVLLERMCLTTPGALVMLSGEFASVWTGKNERRSRLEIRRIAGAFQILKVERTYPVPGDPPRDIAQSRVWADCGVTVFEDIGAAANFVYRYIGAYRGAAADDRATALEHQALDLRDDV